MARPIKKNADYFPHDSDMRNDPKVKAIRRKFGHIGYSVWNMILESLTDSEYFEMEYSELQIELLSGDFDVEPKQLKEIIEYFETVRLITIENGFIQSKRLKERFSPLVIKRERDRKRVFAGENTQSKVKESKVKESKVKETEISVSDSTHKKVDFDAVYNTQWMESVYRRIKDKINFESLMKLWRDFQEEMEARDDLYREDREYREHFPNWVKKQVDNKQHNQTGGILKNFNAFAE